MRHRFHRPGGTIRPSDFRWLGSIAYDARDSYLAGDEGNPVKVVGDFRRFNVENANIAWAIIEGDWSTTKMEYLTSYKSDWRGCELPKDTSGLKTDLVVGIARRLIPTSSFNDWEKVGLDEAMNLVTEDYAKSWAQLQEAMNEKCDAAGDSRTDHRMRAYELFKDYPNILSKFPIFFTAPDEGPKRGPFERPKERYIRVGDELIDLLNDPRIIGVAHPDDRRGIEFSIEAAHPGYRFHLYYTRPWAQAVAAHKAYLGEWASWHDWWRLVRKKF